MIDIRIDEGHILCVEDYIFNVRWKVYDLKDLNYSDEIILSWEDNDLWYKYAKIVINEYL